MKRVTEDTVVTIQSEVLREVAEHEVFLSFTDDLGAEAFQVWWASEGFNQFVEWCREEDEYRGVVDG